MEGIAYLNGSLMPAAEAGVSIFDRGYTSGDSVYDAIRTAGGRPFKLREHLERLYRSLRYTRIDPGLTIDEMETVSMQVLEANLPLLGPNDDFLLWPTVSRGPTAVVLARKIDFRQFARYYSTGAHVVTAATRRTPPQTMSSLGKISNKLNHSLADWEAKNLDAQAYSLMLDINGNVAESAAANVFWVTGGKLCTPRLRNVLRGITRETILELAAEVGIPAEEDDYSSYDVYNADEVFLTTSSYLILPVTEVDGLPVGNGQQAAGPVTERLIDAFSELIDLDFVAQAKSHLN